VCEPANALVFPELRRCGGSCVADPDEYVPPIRSIAATALMLAIWIEPDRSMHDDAGELRAVPTPVVSANCEQIVYPPSVVVPAPQCWRND
jgi:hypothetical protein